MFAWVCVCMVVLASVFLIRPKCCATPELLVAAAQQRNYIVLRTRAEYVRTQRELTKREFRHPLPPPPPSAAKPHAHACACACEQHKQQQQNFVQHTSPHAKSAVSPHMFAHVCGRAHHWKTVCSLLRAYSNRHGAQMLATTLPGDCGQSARAWFGVGCWQSEQPRTCTSF